MAKMGRPKLEVIKNKPVTIRLTEEEYARLIKYAEKHSKTITDVLKEGLNQMYIQG